MKRNYEQPKIELRLVLANDVVTASPASYNPDYNDHYAEDEWND